MPKVNDAKFDYNLISYLITIVETNSMVSAAEVLGVAPSVVSYAVKKLRDHYGDPLFIRSLNGVKPTSLALNLYQKFILINNDMNDAITLKQVQKASTRNIIIQAESLTEFWVTEKLLASGIVPNDCTVEFYSTTQSLEHRINRLRGREVDLDLGFPIPGDKNILGRTLYAFDYVIICRNQHQTVGDTITLEQFSQERYLGFSSLHSETQVRNDFHNIISSRIYAPDIRTASAINLLLTIISRDYLLVLPKKYVDFFQSIFPVREVKNDFFPQGNNFFVAHMHKQNENDELLIKIINTLADT